LKDSSDNTEYQEESPDSPERMQYSFSLVFDEGISKKQGKGIKDKYLEVQTHRWMLGEDHQEKDNPGQSCC
jgi:hypothetical protein